jgi:hypothetical protein
MAMVAWKQGMDLLHESPWRLDGASRSSVSGLDKYFVEFVEGEEG